MRRVLLGLLLATAAAAQTIPTPSPTAQSIAAVSAPLSLLNQTLTCASCVSALGAVGSSPSANGASLTGNTLTLQPADGTHPGLLTSGTQTIGGAKTFSSTVSAPTFDNVGGTTTLGEGGQYTVMPGTVDITGTGTHTVAGPWCPSSSGAVGLGLSSDPWGYNFGLIWAYRPHVLDTCSSTTEGYVEWDTNSGVNTGHRTRLCICRSDGSGTYTWQNLAGSSLTDLGTATTCPD
jgi:hypothetical protein